MEGRDLATPAPPPPPRALTLQPLLLELRRHVADVRPLQRLARHLQRGLRAVEVGQLLGQVHDVRALQPPPRDAAPVPRRVAQLVAEALQLLLAQVLQRRQEQLAGGGRAGLLAAGGQGASGARDEQWLSRAPSPSVAPRPTLCPQGRLCPRAALGCARW